MKKLTLGIFALFVGYGSQAEVLVQWGAIGGESDIVSQPIIENKPTRAEPTYRAGEINSLANSAYYPQSAGRAKEYNFAAGSSYGTHEICDRNSYDFINIGKNEDRYQAMMVWENLPALSKNIDTLSIEIRGAGRAFTDGTYRFLIENNQGWIASEPFAFNSNFTSALPQKTASMTWYSFTPLINGKFDIGPVAAFNEQAATAVGYCFELSDHVSEKFQSANIRYFQATAPITSWKELTINNNTSSNIMVQWGELKQGTDIVTEPVPFKTNAPITYHANIENNPTVGPLYYPNNTNRSPVFNCADGSDLLLNIQLVKDDPNGDHILIGKNCPTVASMIVWENFLTPDTSLNTLDIHVFATSKCERGTYRYLLEKENGEWFASEPIVLEKYKIKSPPVAAANLAWFTFQPIANKVANIGTTPQSINMNSIASVGAYFHLEGRGDWQGVKLSYFQATATEKEDGEHKPLPLLGMTALLVLLRRQPDQK